VGEKLPLRKNVRWFQLAYGAFLALVVYQLYEHAAGDVPLSKGGLIVRVALLGVSFLVFLVYLQNVHRFGLVPDYSLKCFNCHGPVNRYSEFCEHCGADLIAPEKLVVCSRCGAESIEGTKHCPECGARLTQPSKKKGKAKKTAEGWDQPIDATTGVPPPRDDE
jgi:hypothetical protein